MAESVTPVTAADLAALIAAMPKGISGEDLKTILTSVSSDTAQGMKKSLRPENDVHPGVSVFSYPEGEVARPKEALTREVYFVGMKLDPERMTPAEIEAVNRFPPGDRTARGGLWRARVDQDGTTPRLFITVPSVTMDDRMNLPSFLAICLELLDGADAATPEHLLDRVARLEAELSSVRRQSQVGLSQ